jgi:probable rRNA maturation factor
MTSSGSTLLFGAIPFALKPSLADKRAIRQFAATLSTNVAGARTFTCLLADDAHLQRLNREFLRNDYPTDVLSFPSGGSTQQLGEIAISIERAAAQASAFGHNWLDEVKVLMLHGVLHLTGFDHEKDGGLMEREEKRWREEFGLPATLISRAKSRQGAA